MNAFLSSQWTPDRVLEWRIRETPDAPFLVSENGTELSFATFGRSVRDCMGHLAASGVGSEDRVALVAGNSIDHVTLWFATNLLGATDAPINPAFSGRLLEQALTLIDPVLVVAEAGLLPAVHAALETSGEMRPIRWFGSGEVPDESCTGANSGPLAEAGSATVTPPVLSPSGVSSILATSGTTGPAKGVMVTHAQAFLTARQSVEGMRVTADDTFYCAHPLFHMSPRFCVIYAALLTGARVCLDAAFSARRWIDRIRATGATVTIGHGPLVEMIHAQPERDDDAETSLTRIGTSPFPRHIAQDFERRFGVKGIETWGMTEINIPCWHPFEEPLRPGSCGRIREEWYEFRVVNPDTDEEVPAGTVGEFVVRPKLPWIVSPGYFRNPEATVKAWRNLWFHTGDSGYRDAKGWVWFVDRLGDRIRRRAENISSFDIEVAANRYPGVAESAAVGVSSEYASDDDIKLCVVMHPEARLDPVALITHLLDELAHHMVPRYVEVLADLPRTPTGKPRKAVLRETGVTADTWDRKAAGLNLRSLRRQED
ncbi:AMP-binding protein [Nitratireductor mangrovi]|uniref:AMP-binding protein n=1 Tax=Nitratireductor mangrovi TaxID=2599600 RepID=A0A5B8L3S2_9HYPH|nr:AMP-binding protein [Nitratireductor mangrovi]QDZ02310.1 AMP-binding protein [Nitratireductor mangrovi]